MLGEHHDRVLRLRWRDRTSGMRTCTLCMDADVPLSPAPSAGAGWRRCRRKRCAAVICPRGDVPLARAAAGKELWRKLSPAQAQCLGAPDARADSSLRCIRGVAHFCFAGIHPAAFCFEVRVTCDAAVKFLTAASSFLLRQNSRVVGLSCSHLSRPRPAHDCSVPIHVTFSSALSLHPPHTRLSQYEVHQHPRWSFGRQLRRGDLPRLRARRRLVCPGAGAAGVCGGTAGARQEGPLPERGARGAEPLHQRGGDAVGHAPADH